MTYSTHNIPSITAAEILRRFHGICMITLKSFPQLLMGNVYHQCYLSKMLWKNAFLCFFLINVQVQVNLSLPVGQSLDKWYIKNLKPDGIFLFSVFYLCEFSQKCHEGSEFLTHICFCSFDTDFKGLVSPFFTINVEQKLKLIHLSWFKNTT